SGTICLSASLWPAACRRCTNSLPDLSVVSSRLSDTVSTAIGSGRNSPSFACATIGSLSIVGAEGLLARQHGYAIPARNAGASVLAYPIVPPRRDLPRPGHPTPASTWYRQLSGFP